jgi:hypothetical protein
MKYVRYTVALKRFVFASRHHRGESVAATILAVRERFGVELDDRSVQYIVRSECKRAGVVKKNNIYPEKTRRDVLAMARSGKFRSAGEIIRHLSRQMDGRVPSNVTVSLWIRSAGISLQSMFKKGGSMGHAPEVRRMALELYDKGTPISDVCRIVNEAHFTGITRHAVYRWIKESGRTANRKPGPKPGTSHEKIGRRYHMHVHYMLPQGTPQWIRDQVVMSSAFGCDMGLDAVAKQCADMAKDSPLWWTPETSQNPRWTKKRARKKQVIPRPIKLSQSTRRAAA